MHSTFIIIGIIVLGIILSFIFVPYGAQPRRRDSFIRFLLTLLATLAGVFLAFQINNYQETQNEKGFLVSLLDQSASELEVEIEFIDRNYLSSNMDKLKGEELEEFIRIYPLSGVISLDILLNSALLPIFGSPSSANLHSVKRDLDTIRININSVAVVPDSKTTLIKSYKQWLTYLRQLLLVETSYVGGEISAEQASEQYKSLTDEFSSSSILD